MQDLVGFLMVAAPLSLLLGIGAAVYYYLKYRRAPEPNRHPSALLYALGVAGVAAAAFVIGTFAGISVVCRGTQAGNLCGLLGVFISGPLLATAAMMAFARLWMKNAVRPPR